MTMAAVCLVVILLASALPRGAAWRYSCRPTNKYPGRLVSVLQADLEAEKVLSGPATGVSDKADGYLRIRIYQSATGVNVRFEMSTDALDNPSLRTVRVGSAGVNGRVAYRVPGTMAAVPDNNGDGAHFELLSWLQGADRTPSRRLFATVADVLAQMDASPEGFYAQVANMQNLQGVIRGQFRRAKFIPCVQG